MQYMLLIFATILQAADFACNKIYQKREGTSVRAILKFNALLGLFTAVLFWIANGFRLGFTPYSFTMAAVMNLLVLGYNFIGFQLLKRGSVAVYTLFLMTGGTIIFSALIGRFLLCETISSKLVLGIAFCFMGTLLFL